MELELTFQQQVKLAEKRRNTLVKYIVGVMPHPYRDDAEMLYNVGLGLSKLGLEPAELGDTFGMFCEKTELSFTNTPRWKKHFVEGYWSDPYWHGISVAR